jgi:hypothetical protein
MVRKQIDTLAPMRLLKQIVLLQVVYYIMAIVLIAFTLIVGGERFKLETVFSWEPVRLDTTWGWALSMLWLLDTFFCVLAMTYIVGRSKLALDFTLTLHGINFIVAWLVSGKFPASPLWWGVQVVSTFLMVGLGTWTSQWRELSATFFDVGSSSSGSYEMVMPSPLETKVAVGNLEQEGSNSV